MTVPCAIVEQAADATSTTVARELAGGGTTRPANVSGLEFLNGRRG
jgi:hypothetical protein